MPALPPHGHRAAADDDDHDHLQRPDQLLQATPVPAPPDTKDRLTGRDDRPSTATAAVVSTSSSPMPTTTDSSSSSRKSIMAGIKRSSAEALDAAQQVCEKRRKRDDTEHTNAATTPPATTAATAFFHAPTAAAADPDAASRIDHERRATAPPPPPQPQQRVLSPLALATADEIRQHVRDVRREVFLRPLLAVITRLMFHKANHGLFNVRVDPVAWNIPHYLDIVKRPMDLSLVKNKCLNLEYATADDCAADIRLVFANACLFNPPGHAVHEAAKLLQTEFDAEYARFCAKVHALEQKRAAHSCLSCLANVCSICNQKCINFEPPFVVCAGPCQQRIKRHALYYSTPERTHHWCAKCYTSLPKMLTLKAAVASSTDASPVDTTAQVDPQQQQRLVSKTSLVKAKFLDELTEPWVQCDRCNGWVHQICALFNASEDSEATDVPYACPLCRIDELSRAEQDWDVEMSPSGTSVDEFPVQHKFDLMGSHSPVLKRKPSAKEFTRVLGFDSVIEEKVFDFLGCGASTSPALSATATIESAQCSSGRAAARVQGVVHSAQLQSCALSQFMQSWVRDHLVSLGEHAAAQSIVIKVVSSIKTSSPVSPAVREHFRSASQSYPPSIDFTSKAIFVFQQINGIEVCIFSMYVQEYDSASNVVANRHRTYIAYIDSLVYMRPRHVRTRLFHATLIAYLAFCKRRGFEHAHIWACPTTRGGDFIYWCHPSFQKNPGKDRLLQWYLAMADVGKRASVVFACRDLYACAFADLETRLATQLPPYFDGDYWSAEVDRLAAHPPKRGRLSKEAYAASLQGANFRRRIVDSVRASRESLFVIALQPTCQSCHAVIVNRACWKRASEPDDVYVCVACYDATSDAHDPAAPSMVFVPPPSFVGATESDTHDAAADDDVEIRCAFLDHRPDMLKHCEEQHYQFDTYRRAKYSTMMLLYQISSAQQQQQQQQETANKT